MKFPESKGTFRLSSRKITHSLILCVVLLICLSFYIVGCESDAYFASSAFLCDNTIEGVSCEDPSSAQGGTEGNQGTSSQNLLSKHSPAGIASKNQLNTSSQRLLMKAGAQEGAGRLMTIKSKLDKVNILFVIDSSGSMSQEQQSIANQFDDFLNTLGDLDYHIAIITNNPPHLGEFIPFPNGELWLSNPGKSRSVHNENVTYFQQTVKRPGGNTPEQGIASLNAALDKRRQYDFFRPHSLLVAIIVSDDDENGGPDGGSPMKPVNQPEIFFEKVNDLHPYSLVTVHSIIFKPEDNKTSCPNGDAHGHIYASASNPSRTIMEEYGNILRGHIGSICATNYSSQLGPVATHIIENRVIPLPCRLFSKDSVAVSVNGQPVKFTVDGRKVFIKDGVPFGAEMDMSFRCKK